MRRKQGFTLFEILIVVSIVAILGVSSTVILTRAIENSKKNRLNNVINEIENAADVYINVNNDTLRESLYNCGSITECSINVTLGTLQGALLIGDDLRNPGTNKPFSTMSYVKITYNKSNEKITYEFLY